MNGDEPHDPITEHDVRILRAFLRSEELRRQRFERELDRLRTSRPSSGASAISRWIAEVTRQRWEEELEAVNRSIARITERLRELEALQGGPEDADPSAGTEDEEDHGGEGESGPSPDPPAGGS